MTTEVVLLLGIFVFLVGGLFFRDKGPIKVFESSGPRLAARVENQISTGRGFKVRGTNNQWLAPTSAAPTGLMK